MEKLKIYTILIIFIILSVNPIGTSLKGDNSEEISININTGENNFIISQKIIDIMDKIDESLIEEYLIKIVSYSPRETGTYGCEKTGEYIYNQFEQMDINVRYHEWEKFVNNKNYKGIYKSNNVEGTIKGKNLDSDKIVLLNSHYDSVKISPGANDNGAGTAGVLTAAFALSQFDFQHSIKLLTFSGEEQGLLGSIEYVEELYENDENIFVEINADMIGRAVTSEGGKQMGLSITEDILWIPDLFRSLSDAYGLNFEISSMQMPRLGLSFGSDFSSFVNFGYESAAVWESDGDPYMHTENDGLENVNISYLTNMTKLITGALAYIADDGIIQPQVKIVSPRKGIMYFEDRKIRDLEDFNTVIIDDVLIIAEATPGAVPIDYVEFYYNGIKQETDNEAPYQYRLNKISFTKHFVKVVAYDKNGDTSTDQIIFKYFNLLKNR